jgi:uncharacterized protein YjiS (DUF1127 family)
MTRTQAIAIGTRNRTSARALFDLAVRACVDAYTAVLYAHRRRKTIAALRTLDDRTLQDIGLSRTGIVRAAETAARHPTKWPRHWDLTRYL